MAKGDTNDIHERLCGLLPPGWFTEDSPTLKAVVSAAARSLSWCYSLYLYAREQTRIRSATGGWLDLAAWDFFGPRLIRSAGLSDEQFRRKITIALFRAAGTRQAISELIKELTGSPPRIFEPQCPLDTGAYGEPHTGYGMAGGYGSSLLPYQGFITVNRPKQSGIPWVAGYRTPSSGYHCPSRGQYVSDEQVAGAITNEQIFKAIAATKLEGTLVWVRIQ